MGPGYYLCGCSVEQKKMYSSHLLPDNRSFTNNRLDSEGFIVCPEHGLRIYGWRSAHMGRVSEHPYLSDSPLERQRRTEHGGRIPESKPLKLRSDVSDKRDNRDPQAVGYEFLSRSNGHGP